MDYRAYQSRLSLLSSRFNLMVFLVFGLLISNTILASFLFTAFKHHQVEITPFSGAPGYFKSASTVDSHYLSMMAENFVNERLNVTPKTVDANHERILSFVHPSIYAPMLKILLAESKTIKAKTMSSSFTISQIHFGEDKLLVKVRGTLKRYVGIQALREEEKSYVLVFQYRDSKLSILSFKEVKEQENA